MQELEGKDKMDDAMEEGEPVKRFKVRDVMVRCYG